MVDRYERLCQSCGMLMGITDEHYGTEANGEKSTDYCGYCYMDGKFKRELTLEEMTEICVSFAVDENTTEEQARERLNQVLPTLKRWQTQQTDGVS